MTKRQAIFGLGLIAGGAGALGWWVFHPRPLDVGLRIEKASAQSPLMGDPLATQLSVLPARETPKNNIIRAQCAWTLQSVQYRVNETSPWRDLKRDEKNPVVSLYSQHQKTGYSDIFFPHYKRAGEWKSVVRADVDIQTLSGRWHGQVSHPFHDVISQADLQRRIAQRAAVESHNNRATRESVPSGAVAVVPGKRYISKIQWSDDAGEKWHDAPAADRGFVAVPHLTSLGLRAVKADAKTEWPDYPDFLPRWKFGSQNYFGAQVFLEAGAVSRNAADLRAATVDCGQQMSVKIRVLPPGDLVVYASRDAVKLGSKSGPTRVYARYGGREVPRDARIYFMVYNADDTRADLINKTGFKDDIVALDGRIASATLREGEGVGTVTIIARMGDKSNRLLANSQVNATVKFLAPTPPNGANGQKAKP